MVARGQPRLGEDLTAPLLARLVELSEQLGHFQLVPEDPVPLSQREEEVALEISKGKSNQEIADDLFISTGTVKNHVHRILRKLNVKDRRQAGIIYRQLSEREAGEQPEDRPIPA
ncbi:MAG: response regulator transcription factor [Thermomicrobiales bacterium]